MEKSFLGCHFAKFHCEMGFYNSIMKLWKLGAKSKTKLGGILSCCHSPAKQFIVVTVHLILLVWGLQKCMSWKTRQAAIRKLSRESRTPECTVSSSGLPSSRKMRSYWKESSGGLRGWWGDWNNSPMRKGWGSWARLAWRREGSEGIF